MYNNKKEAFTLIEIMVWIIIISIVMIWWFKWLSAVSLWKVRLIQQTQMEKQSFYFVEKFFEMVKKWWTLDYEEYFNRKVVWNSTYMNWHYDKQTGYWNFWVWGVFWSTIYWADFYYCRSWSDSTLKISNTIINPSKWCYKKSELNTMGIDLSWHFQRYWQFSFQFIDYNSNYNNDTIIWDEDWDWKIIWDEDDEYLWIWPEVFSQWDNIKELYLISWNKKERTLFRLSIIEDPDKPPSTSCDLSTWIWDWCLWTIQFLKLSWVDWWTDHDSLISNRTYDWVIDTWLIHEDFKNWNIVAWSDNNNYRVDLFPKNINVSEFKVFAYPNNDIALNWKDNLTTSYISPYIKIQFKLKPSWWARTKMRWIFKEINYSTTINLTNIFSN